MTDNLFRQRLSNINAPFLIMSHRGLHGGNIIMNTLEAYEMAIKAGSDIVEIDICRSADGDYYLFHDNEELSRLGIDQHFSQLSTSFIDSHSLLNSISTESGYYAVKFPEFLKWLPQGVLVNIDRSWLYWNDAVFIDLVMQSDKINQLLFKSPVREELLVAINSWPQAVNYMPIIYKAEEVEVVESYSNIQTIGLELIINDFATHDFTEEWRTEKAKNYLIMYNAEDLGKGYYLFDHLNDSGAILGKPNNHWGVMIKMGGTILQTDWPYFMRDYRDSLNENI